MPQTTARSLAVLCRLLSVAAFALLLGVQGAYAGVYTDDLSKCLVKNSTNDDKVTLVQWMFSAISLHPAVRPFSSFTPAQRDHLNEQTADLFSRLLTVDCRKQAIDALKYEGSAALGSSFQVLGQVAARSLMTDPDVAKAMGGVGSYFEKDQNLKALLKDAAISEPNTAAPDKAAK